jgi:two-component system NarL family sensor kinase
MFIFEKNKMKLNLVILLAFVCSCQQPNKKNASAIETSKDSTTISLNFEKASATKDSSIFYLSQAKEVMLKNGSQRCLATLLFLEGKQQLMLSHLDSANQIADSGLRIQFLPENRFFKGKFYNIKGNVAGFKREIYQSLEYYTAAEKVFITAKDSNSLAGIYSNITNTYFSLKDYKTGLEYSSKAYQLLPNVQENRIKTNILITYAIALTKNQQFSKALTIQKKADSISTLTNDVIVKMAVAIGYAELYKETKQYKLSEKYYKDCILLSKETGIKHFELMSNVGLLSLYETTHKNSIIIEKSDSVIRLAQQLNNVDVLHTTQRIIGRAYAKNDNFKKAFYNLDASYTLYDSTSGIQNQKNINELRVKYKVQKSEKEALQQSYFLAKQKAQLREDRILLVILLLLFGALLLFIVLRKKLNKAKLDQLILKNDQNITNALIEGEEKERMRIAFEIHDGIASMVTGISYKIASERRENAEILALLSDLHEESRKISHNLMPIDFEEINIITALNSLCQKNSSNEVEIFLMTEEKTLKFSIQKCHILYRIIQELINNALKYSGCKSIFVKIENKLDVIYFSVEDDGIGIEDEKSKNGLKSIRKRVEILDGKLTIESEPFAGTKIEIAVEQ